MGSKSSPGRPEDGFQRDGLALGQGTLHEQIAERARSVERQLNDAVDRVFSAEAELRSARLDERRLRAEAARMARLEAGTPKS